MILIEEDLFQNLDPAYQTALKEAAKEASVLQRKKQREADLAVKKLALDEGIKIFEMSPVDRKKFVDASVELYDEYRKNRSRSILEKVEASAEKG
jgi:TRAP-type C4-dicarboxylate transport system substrate-binding protein